MIAIVNYGSGNIQAIANIFGRLHVPFSIASTPADLLVADKVVLPGVGAFDQAMTELNASDMRRALDHVVCDEKRPILGICVGMQLLARSSEEGTTAGLGWIDGTVRRFDPASFRQTTHLPHMGWNSVEPTQAHPLFDGVDLATGFYFLHSYYFECHDPENALGLTEYGRPFTSVVHRDNVFGVQFHPEKSHHAGIQLLKNFAER